jgi:hypothetical protein
LDCHRCAGAAGHPTAVYPPAASFLFAVLVSGTANGRSPLPSPHSRTQSTTPASALITAPPMLVVYVLPGRWCFGS